MKIMAWPKSNNIQSNKYNYLLYKDFGSEVYEFKKIHKYWKYDIFHIHWPETYFNKENVFLQAFGSLFVLITLDLFKIFGAKVIWTVHNLEPHNRNYRKNLSSVFYKRLISSVDGFIFLSHTSLGLFETKFKVSLKNTCVIPHGLYYKSNLNFSESNIYKTKFKFYGDYFLFFGLLREYKGIEQLIDLFKRVNYRLVIVGKPESQAYLNYLLGKAPSKNITIIPKFLIAEELDCIISNSNGVIIPFKKILNSGSLIHSISLNKPVLVPLLPQFIELKNLLKDDLFINFIENELSNYDFDKFRDCCMIIKENNLKINKEPLEWELLRNKTINFFYKVLRK